MKRTLRYLLDYALIPAFVVAGLLALAATFVEGPALQPFLYGVF